MKYLLTPLLFCCLAFQCADDEDLRLCGEPIIVVNELLVGYDTFHLVNVAVADRCLTVEIGASGCSPDGWALQLRTEGTIRESLPTQSTAHLTFDDGVAEGAGTCQAYYTAAYSFDLRPYLPEGSGPSLLTLEGLDTTLLVE